MRLLFIFSFDKSFTISQVLLLYMFSLCSGLSILGFYVFKMFLGNFFWQKQDFKYSLRCFSTTGDSVQSTPQGSPESDCVVPQRIKFKRLDKTAKHIMQVQLKLDNYHGYNHVIFYLCHNLLQIVDKEAVEEVRNLREIPEIKPGYIVQLKVVSRALDCNFFFSRGMGSNYLLSSK